MKKNKEVKTLQNGGKQESRSIQSHSGGDSVAIGIYIVEGLQSLY